MFRRRRHSEDAVDQPAEKFEDFEEPTDDVEDVDGAVLLPPAPRPDGPWDVSELDDPYQGRVDLGGLLIPAVEGMELRAEVPDDRSVPDDRIIAATVIIGQSAVQLQAFAAPKSEGIWREVRAEIASGITQQGGVVEEIEGPFGWELRAAIPVQLPDGKHGTQMVRFVGTDGPRWFLRGVISGQAAAQPESAEVLERIFRGVVVVRGGDAMAPRDPIPMRLPPEAASALGHEAMSQTTEEAGDESPQRTYDDLNPFGRGPEVTEVR